MNLKQIDRLAFSAFQAIKKDVSKLTPPQWQELIKAFIRYTNPLPEPPTRPKVVSTKKILTYFHKKLNPTEIGILCGCSRTYVYEVLEKAGLFEKDKK